MNVRRVVAYGRSRPLRASDLAWLGAIPCAALVVAAIVLLGPPLGALLFPPSPLTFWPGAPVAPEPTEHARFLVALTAPLLLAGFVVLMVRRPVGLRPRTARALVVGVQVVAVAFLVLCMVVQYRFVSTYSSSNGLIARIVYFTPSTLAVAAVLAAALGGGLASERVTREFEALCRERRGRRIAGAGIVAVAIVLWVLPAFNSEGTIVNANPAIIDHIRFWLDEAFAPLDGRFPLAGYTAQYGSLWPYPVAAAMALLGASIGVFTAAMALINGVTMLALFGVVRRVARSTVGGVLLFLPLLATSFYMMEGPLADRYATVNLFSTFPLRYAGPFLLLWLVARHLDGARPARPRWLFLAAGLVVLNNVDFGLSALAATIAALLWSRRRPPLGRLALEAGGGLAGATVLVSVLTLVLAGSLPHLGALFRFSSLFALAGFGMLPMHPVIGVSTIVFLTYVAAILVATVRVVEGDSDRLMTGLLVWSGVFGLGVGSYYVGRSHPEVLTNMFAPWALSLVLLFVLSVRRLATRPRRLPSLADAAVLFGFGVLACSLAQTPTPWTQLRRIENGGPQLYRRPAGEPFMAQHVRRGEPVAILTGLGHRAGYDLHVVDVTPYAGIASMPAVQQLDETLAALRAAGGRKVFADTSNQPWAGIPEALAQRGYRLRAEDGYSVGEFVRSR